MAVEVPSNAVACPCCGSIEWLNQDHIYVDQDGEFAGEVFASGRRERRCANCLSIVEFANDMMARTLGNHRTVR